MPVSAIDLKKKYDLVIENQFAGREYTAQSIRFKNEDGLDTNNKRLDKIRALAQRSFANISPEESDAIAKEMDKLAELKKDKTKIESIPLPSAQERDDTRRAQQNTSFQTGTFIGLDGSKKTSFQLEAASTEQQRDKGLMDRDSLPAKQGMLFAFSTEGIRPFWMRRTKIPLDMVFLDKNKKVVGILKNVPPNTDDSRYPNDTPSMYCVELNAGSADKFGIAIGDKLS